ncbi:alpha/beta fold hydrolase [Thioclava sp. 15-R06ZXC-3]|uniref:Alpha/beta fold hydrolase n=1 Tax=Thioclava arctica TaxID=3238301 RepID=A0ABV3TNJ8_9RHOB
MARLGYETIGHGPLKVLALHGWFGDQTMLDPMKLALNTEAFTYVCPSYRGYGASRELTGSYDMAEISADVLELADALGWKRFSLIGHSMGGMAIQRVLADAPDRVEKMVALTPVPASGVPLDEGSAELFGGAAANMDNRSAIIDFTTGNRLTSVWINAMARYSGETARDDAFAAYLPSWTKADFHQEIAGNPVPLKVIVGANDPALSADVMEATYMQWYPNAELEVMPNAGHYPMNETPVALATSVERFLSGQ